MEMSGNGAELTEYLIGVRALGRSADYSPHEDSSVRTRAYELRQRLKKLYGSELAEAAVRIDLPKGSYLPAFVFAPSKSVVASAPRLAEPEHRRGGLPQWLQAGATGALLASCVAAAIWWISPGGETLVKADPVIREAWASLRSPEADLQISMAAPLHLLVSPYMNTTPGNLPKFPAPQELYNLFSRYRPLPTDAKLEMQPVQKALALGDVQALAQILATLSSLGIHSHILPETNSPLPALRTRSGFLVGSPWYSRAASVLLEKTPWTIQLDPESREISIIGQGATGGKKYVPIRGPRGEYQEVFGLLTVLAGEPGGSGPRTLVVVSGLTSVGAHGAASFFSSARDMRQLRDRFEREGVKGFPPSYQVIVRCRASEDSQLLTFAYETHRALGR